MTFALSWLCWFFATRMPAAAGLLYLLGVFGPAIVGFWFTARAGRAEIQSLIERLTRWRVGARWYVFAVSYFAIVKLAAALLYRISTGFWPRFGHESVLFIAAAIVLSWPIQAGEEIGWRGYALPRLSARIGLASGSVLLGAVWGLWHLPFFFMPAADKYGQSLSLFVVGTIAFSIAMAWLYARTNGSILLAMLMHSAINQTSGIIPTPAPGASNPFALSASLIGWLTAILLWITALYFLDRMSRMRLRPE